MISVIFLLISVQHFLNTKVLTEFAAAIENLQIRPLNRDKNEKNLSDIIKRTINPLTILYYNRLETDQSFHVKELSYGKNSSFINPIL